MRRIRSTSCMFRACSQNSSRSDRSALISACVAEGPPAARHFFPVDFPVSRELPFWGATLGGAQNDQAAPIRARSLAVCHRYRIAHQRPAGPFDRTQSRLTGAGIRALRGGIHRCLLCPGRDQSRPRTEVSRRALRSMRQLLGIDRNVLRPRLGAGVILCRLKAGSESCPSS